MSISNETMRRGLLSTDIEEGLRREELEKKWKKNKPVYISMKEWKKKYYGTKSKPIKN